MDNKDIHIQCQLSSNCTIDALLFKKMALLFNAIEDGWTVKKTNKSYIFKKKHENKTEVYDDDYIMNFMKAHMDTTKYIINN